MEIPESAKIRKLVWREPSNRAVVTSKLNILDSLSEKECDQE